MSAERHLAIRNLAAVNQALHELWPHMDLGLWGVASQAVQKQLSVWGMPPDLRPSGVLTAITAAAIRDVERKP